MGLTSAMYTGLSGLRVNETRIEGIGNNIANVNTNGFKSTRTLFQTQLSRLLAMGSAPSDTSGGTNPMQVGLGATVGSTQRTTTLGTLETTGLNTDMAVEGAGYFIVSDAAGGAVLHSRWGVYAERAESARYAGWALCARVRGG